MGKPLPQRGVRQIRCTGVLSVALRSKLPQRHELRAPGARPHDRSLCGRSPHRTFRHLYLPVALSSTSDLARLVGPALALAGLLVFIQISSYVRMLFAIRATPVPRPQFSPYNATDDWTPLERREAMAETVTALGLEGFQLVMDVFWESPKRRLAVLSNDATGEYAALLSNTFSGGRGALTLSITCEFADGRELSVDDSSSSVLPASPQLTRWQLPMAHPPARLLRAFRYLLGRDFPGLHPTIRDENLTIEERIRRSMVRETTHWIVAGY